MSDKNYSPQVPDAYQLALNTINQLAGRLDGMTAMYKDEFRYRQMAEARVKTLEDALNAVKVRAAFIGWPAESFWEPNGIKIPDWRYELKLIEQALAAK